MTALSGQLAAAYLVEDEQGNVVGALGLRPTPKHGAELVGGAFPGAVQHEAVTTLLQAALSEQPRLYAYAEGHLLPEAALQEAGLRWAGAFTRLVGPLPDGAAQVPSGYHILPLAAVPSREARLAAQAMYSDRIGHTQVPPEVADTDFGGSDDRLSRIALDETGNPSGICRVWLNGEEASLGTPGVHPAARGTGLRHALLLAACGAAREAGAARVVLDAWGDTDEERQADEALGFLVQDLTPIYAAVSHQPADVLSAAVPEGRPRPGRTS